MTIHSTRTASGAWVTTTDEPAPSTVTNPATYTLATGGGKRSTVPMGIPLIQADDDCDTCGPGRPCTCTAASSDDYHDRSA
jgi:hypothetical protein